MCFLVSQSWAIENHNILSLLQHSSLDSPSVYHGKGENDYQPGFFFFDPDSGPK